MAIIVIPTLGLLALGVQSVRRQRQAIEVLTIANARLAVERLAEALERHVADAGALALRDPDLASVSGLLVRQPAAERQRALREHLARSAARHPVVLQWLILKGTRMQFPLTGMPLPEDIDDLVAGASGLAAGFAVAFAEAEDLEASGARAPLAAAAYRRASDLARTPRLRGIALARAARSYRSAGDAAAASRAWQQVASRYGDEYDLFHQPYGLAAALELCELEGHSGCREAVRLARDIAAGRWELSASQATALIARLERLGPPASIAAAVHGSRFLAELRTAEAVERAWAALADGRSDEVRLASIPVGDFHHQPVACAASPPAGDAVTVCLAVNMGWAATVLLPELAREIAAAVEPTLGRSPAAGAPSVRPTIAVPLGSAFEGWVMTAREPEAAASALRLDTAVFGGTTLAVVGVLLLGVVLMVRDVSRQAEMARLRSDFVSGVSHQLRTPLTLIRLYGELLTEYPDAPEAERRERLAVITSESERLTTLIERVLDFSRVERGLKPYALSLGDLGAALRPVVDVYASYLRRRGFTVDASLPEDLPEVRFDPDALSDAVVNLMDNASKYASDGRYVGVALSARGADVVLEVSDRGPGIPTTDLARLFQPFQRGSAGREKGGYGLGLFLVRHTMEAHGGRVEVDSRPGQGTTFRLVFPAEGAAERWRRS